MGFVAYNAMVEAAEQKRHLRGCSGQEKIVEYRKALKSGIGASLTAVGNYGNTKQCDMLLSKWGAGFWKWSCNGDGEGAVFQFVSHNVKTGMDGK